MAKKPTHPDHTDLITGSPWLRSIDPGFARALLRASYPVSVQRGELIFERGDPPGSLYFVQDGLVCGRMDDAGSSVLMCNVFKPGDWFGVATALTMGPRLIDAEAARDSTLLRVPLRQMHDLCDSDPQGWRWLAILGAMNNAVAVQIARDLLITDPRQRAISVIRRSIGQDKLPFELTLTQIELAEMCALSRGVVSRVLGVLAKEGCLKLGYGAMTILDHPIWRPGW